MELVDNQPSVAELGPVEISRRAAVATRLLSATYSQADKPKLPEDTKQELAAKISNLYAELSRLSTLLANLTTSYDYKPSNHDPWGAISIASTIEPGQLPKLRAELDNLQAMRRLPEFTYPESANPGEQSVESPHEYRQSNHSHQ